MQRIQVVVPGMERSTKEGDREAEGKEKESQTYHLGGHETKRWTSNFKVHGLNGQTAGRVGKDHGSESAQ